MPVLLLARGDTQSRDLLKRAIEARYGLRPPVIETMELSFKGRARVKLGPMTTWVALETETWFRLPEAMRWDFVVKPVGVPIQRGIESYDGDTFRRVRGGKMTHLDDKPLIESAQRRLWAIAALLLTPLGDSFVQLERADDYTITATNTNLGAAVQVHLQDDYRLREVSVPCLNPDTNQQSVFRLVTEGETVSFDELLFPQRIKAFWEDTPWFEAEPTIARHNTDIDEATFTLSEI